MKHRKETGRLSLSAITFDEAITDLLKVKPPEKPKRKVKPSKAKRAKVRD